MTKLCVCDMGMPFCQHDSLRSLLSVLINYNIYVLFHGQNVGVNVSAFWIKLKKRVNLFIYHISIICHGCFSANFLSHWKCRLCLKKSNHTLLGIWTQGLEVWNSAFFSPLGYSCMVGFSETQPAHSSPADFQWTRKLLLTTRAYSSINYIIDSRAIF